MKRLRTLFAGAAFAASLAINAPVSADLPVIDVSGLKQSILTAAHTLQEVNNQITQIQQFVQMLENEARNLLSLPFSALQQITSAIDQVNNLMKQFETPMSNLGVFGHSVVEELASKNKESHERTADLLEQVGGHADEFIETSKRLRALVAGKTAIEYENKSKTATPPR